MFPKAALLALSFAFVASAALVDKPPNVIRIPLQKRSSLTKADGSFDREAAIRQTIKVQKSVVFPIAACEDPYSCLHHASQQAPPELD